MTQQKKPCAVCKSVEWAARAPKGCSICGVRTQHTPGPWGIPPGDSGAVWAKRKWPLGSAICVLSDPPYHDGEDPPQVKDVIKANAHLIAAAPDLLDDHRANRDDAAGAAVALNDYLSTVVNDTRLEAARLLLAAVSRRSEDAIAKATE